MKSRKDFFQTINGFPHSLAIYLTFTLDKSVINKIAENSYGNIIILHDYRQGVSLKNNWNNRVACIPVHTFSQHQQNCFHSKLALLKGDDKAKLLLGSANLSKDAFSKEKEICFETELDFNSELYNSVIDYILSLIPQTHTSTYVLQKAINKFRFSIEPIRRTTGLRFIYDTESMSIFDNITNHLKRDEQPILKIASPFLSSDFQSDFSGFISKLNPKEVHFYLRKGYPLPEAFNTIIQLKLFEPKLRSARNGFHAKIISIEYSNKEVVFVGSPNFSRQGIFMNLKQGANQECGIVISSTSKNVLSDWFNEGWEKPITINEWKEDAHAVRQTAELFSDRPYVWAELTNKKVVTIFFYIPDNEMLEHIYADGNNLILEKRNPSICIFQSGYQHKSEVIRIAIGNDFSEEITIFNEIVFEQKARELGDSLFYEANRIGSINPSILKETIEKEGVKVKTLGAVVVQPPYLEKYFFNVKHHISVFERRKFYSDYHIQELQTLLNDLSEGEGIYFIIQLLKLFNDKKQKHLFNICNKRIKELIVETLNLNISTSSFETFFKNWKKY